MSWGALGAGPSRSVGTHEDSVARSRYGPVRPKEEIAVCASYCAFCSIHDISTASLIETTPTHCHHIHEIFGFQRGKTVNRGQRGTSKYSIFFWLMMNLDLYGVCADAAQWSHRGQAQDVIAMSSPIDN
jgi:hypothetical protein